MTAVKARLICDAITIVKAIEDAIALSDHYNSPFEDGPVTLADCEFPDDIVDPLELVRLTLGAEYANQLEYDGDLQHIANTIQLCIDGELKRRGQSVFDLETEGSDSESGDERARGVD